MKKKILSFILTLSVVFSMFTFFGFSASAFHEGETIFPGGSINVSLYTYYHEVILSGFSSNVEYDIPLNIPHSGDVIIQSFGPSAGYAPELTLLDANATEVLRSDTVAPYGFKTQGYAHQSLFQFESSGGSYTLRVKPRNAQDMRLSITIAEAYFETETPISVYEDIQPMEGGVFSGTFYEDTQAMVARFQPAETRSYTVSTEGFTAMRGLILDPSSNSFYQEIELIGETSSTIELTGGVDYYVVLFVPIAQSGENDWVDVPYAVLTLTII